MMTFQSLDGGFNPSQATKRNKNNPVDPEYLCYREREREGYYQLYRDFKKPSSRSLLNQSGFHVMSDVGQRFCCSHSRGIDFCPLRLKLVDCSSYYKPGRIFFPKKKTQKTSVTGKKQLGKSHIACLLHVYELYT